ncbi:MAG: heme exporter protein B [Pseudohongiellaceae bacterium]
MSEQNHSAQGLLSVLAVVLKREFLTAYRSRQELANPLVFFVIVIVLFPLGVSPEPEFLKNAAAGLIWVAALLATMLSLDRLFQSDYDDGSLEQLVLCAQPLYLIVLIKSLIHWSLTGLPLIILSPFLATMLHLDAQHIPVLMLTLLIGTPVISLIGGIGAALTVSLRSGGILISLLVLPLTIPVLIFGTGTVQSSIDGLSVAGHFSIMGIMLALALTLSPFAISAALKISVTD